MRISRRLIPAGAIMRKRGRNQLAGNMAPSVPFAESCGSSAHKVPAVNFVGSLPKRLAALAGTPSPKMGAAGKSVQAPIPQVGCVMFGFVGSRSFGEPPPASGGATSMTPPPLPLSGSIPLDAPEPVLAPEPLLWTPDPGWEPPALQADAATAPMQTATRAKPTSFRMLNTPNKPAPERNRATSQPQQLGPS